MFLQYSGNVSKQLDRFDEDAAPAHCCHPMKTTGSVSYYSAEFIWWLFLHKNLSPFLGSLLLGHSSNPLLFPFPPNSLWRLAQEVPQWCWGLPFNHCLSLISIPLDSGGGGPFLLVFFRRVCWSGSIQNFFTVFCQALRWIFTGLRGLLSSPGLGILWWQQCASIIEACSHQSCQAASR